MSSFKVRTLNNVLHVPDIHKNLVSGSLLNENDFKLVIVSDKFVLSKNDKYVGKSYLSDGLFKLNVLTVEPKSINNNKVSTFAYIVKSFVWHRLIRFGCRLGHVNFNSLQNLTLMQIIDVRCVGKYKMTKAHFHSTSRITKPLELINNVIFVT